MIDETKKDKGWQIAAVLMLLTVMSIVFYFAGGTEYVADHSRTVAEYIDTQFDSVATWFDEGETSNSGTIDRSAAPNEEADGGNA